MKKFLTVALMLTLVVGVAPAFAGTDSSTDTVASGHDQVNNIKTGGRNSTSFGVEVMDNTAIEAAKGKTTGEQLTGVAAGGIVGVRKGIHRVGAGAIDLFTFWIPKKAPLITPEEPRLK